MIDYHVVHLTGSCANRCDPCTTPGRDRDTSAIRDEVDTLDRAAGVLFEGREPTERDDLIDLIVLARDHGHRRIMLTTNGRLFSDAGHLRRVLDAGCAHLRIKVFGTTAERHDAVSGVSGSFHETLRGLANCRSCLDDLGRPFDPFIELSVPLSRDTAAELPDILRLGIYVKADRVRADATAGSGELARTAESIKEAAVVSVMHRLWLSVVGFPLCLLGSAIDHAWELVRGMTECTAEKVEVCTTCRLDPLCPGVASGSQEELAQLAKPFGDERTGYLPTWTIDGRWCG